ncbi:hypothetical protein V1514DRAFT_300662 [Lipomyces japonicus]|uniref:uncharacterized protein n=1 Tax=Lipomyces japonicus TaxID=56871 RepID=UPI0034CE2CB2
MAKGSRESDEPTSSDMPLLHLNLSDQRPASPPLYNNESPKATDESALLVHSPGYYDDDDLSYFAGRNVEHKKACLARRAFHYLKWPALIGVVAACCVLLSLLTVHAVSVNSPVLYAKQAINLNISSVSVLDLSSEGLHAHVQGEISFDSSRVKDRSTRILGRIATSIMRKAEVRDTFMIISKVDLNDGSKVDQLGRATVPNIVVDIRDNHVTPIDFISNVEDIADVEDIAKLVRDYLQGNLKEAIFRGDADLPLQSGILPLGTHHVAHDIKFQGGIGGAIPFSISEFSFSRNEKPGIMVKVDAVAKNPYPIHLNLPALDWIIEAPVCHDEFLVNLVVAHSEALLVNPRDVVELKVSSQVAKIPKPFLQRCPGTDTTAMDKYLSLYLAGETITLYVHGKPAQVVSDMPPWLTDILAAISIPVPIPGRTSRDGSLDNMIKSYGLSKVKLTMPNRGAPNDDSYPRISALVNAVIELPHELAFPVAIDSIRGVSDMLYENDKFGVLLIDDWTPAQSSYTKEGYIQVVAEITDIPLEVTDGAVFKALLQRMFFAGEAEVDVDGTIDVDLETPVGTFIVQKIPAKGSIVLRRYSVFSQSINAENEAEKLISEFSAALQGNHQPEMGKSDSGSVHVDNMPLPLYSLLGRDDVNVDEELVWERNPGFITSLRRLIQEN